jgi:electron-transferring-flavoprotein dehydrogenase
MTPPAGSLNPARHQIELPLDRLILKDPPSEDAIDLDVLFVGAGPAALAGAIELARLDARAREAGGKGEELRIGVLEKAETLGDHALSGAVVNPRALRELFPELEDSAFPLRARVEAERVFFLTRSGSWRLPTPPTMRNKGFYVASICEVVRWLGERAERLGVNIFTGFPAGALLVEEDRVAGVRTVAAGLDRSGARLANYMPPSDVRAKVTVLAEGSRGLLAQAYCAWQGIRSPNPQIYALGVKEIWRTARPVEAVIHTMGWPLPRDAFGGSFFYPLEPRLAAIGLVVGLDYRDASLDVHDLLQRIKLHPVFRPYLDGGEMVEWGAKTIPEGGFYSLPERRHGHGVLIVGDSAGLVDVPSLKGIHYAMQSGIFAARAIHAALAEGDPTAERLREYDRLVDRSYIATDLHRTRNMRLGFKHGLLAGSAAAGLASLTGGRLPRSRIPMEPDAAVDRRSGRPPLELRDGKLTFSKVDAVFRSGNSTRDTIPTHLLAGAEIPADVVDFYARLCPAGVYERDEGGLKINAPNCVDCKATDVLGPRWTPREGGSGPRYKQM